VKVLIVHPQMAIYGGAEIVIVKLAKYLEANNHKVSILTLTTANHKDYDNLDIILPPLEKDRIQYRMRNGSIPTLIEIFQIYNVMKSMVRENINDYDIVNTHNFPAIWTIPNNKPAVWMLNEIPDLWHNQHIPKLVNPLLNAGRFGDRIISKSKKPSIVVADKRMAKLCEHRYQIAPHVIPYGIDSEFWGEKIQANRADYQLKENDFVIIAPSMVTPCKKQSDILDAILALNQVIPDLKVIFAGYKDDNNDYTKQLFQFISDNSLKENVIFTGMIDREQLRTLYNLANIAVFAGSGQGSWLGGFEALATGTPIIVSPQLTCSELVKSEKLGIVNDNLVESLKEIYEHRKDFKKQAEQQKEYVQQYLTWDNFCKTMTECMRVKLEGV